MRLIRKISFSLLIVIVGFSFQFDSLAKVYNEDSVIQKIRLEYHNTNRNLGSYKRVEKTLLDFSAEGSSLKLYYFNKRLKKIYVKHFGETGYSASEYYFDNSILFR